MVQGLHMGCVRAAVLYISKERGRSGQVVSRRQGQEGLLRKAHSTQECRAQGTPSVVLLPLAGGTVGGAGRGRNRV